MGRQGLGISDFGGGVLIAEELGLVASSSSGQSRRGWLVTSHPDATT